MPKTTKETKNESLFRKAVDAITECFNDLTVDPETARENLLSLRDEIELLLSTLPKG